MSEIRIKIDEIKNLDSSLKRITSNLITARTNVSSIRYSVDSRILVRRNIGARINNSCNSIGTLENKLQTLQSFIDSSMDRYGTAVNNVDKKALELGSIEKEKSGGLLAWLSNIESDIFGNKSPLGSFEALFEDIEADVSKEWKMLSSMVSLDFNEMYNFVENSWNKVDEESKDVWNAAQIAWNVEKSTHPLGSGLLSGIVDSVKGCTIDLIGGVLTQVSDLIKNPVSTLEEWGQTLYTIKCITQPMTAQEMEIRDKVIEGLCTNVKNDFIKDVINGDEYSRTKYFTSAAVTIGSFFVGVGEIKAAASGGDALKGIEAVEDVDKVANETNVVIDAEKVIGEERNTDRLISNGEKWNNYFSEKYGAENVNRVTSDSIILKHEASSGVILQSTPSKTTTILGNYNRDTGPIISELNFPRTTDFEARDGYFNLLNTENARYVDADQFWYDYNKPWLDKAIERNDEIILATEPYDKYLYRINIKTNKIELSGFGKEYNYLISKGYTFDLKTKVMIPPIKGVK